MPYYRNVGRIPAKKHIRFPQAGGELFHEEMMGAEGFSGENALLYHRHSPTGLVSVDTWDAPEPVTTPNHPVRPMHLKPLDLDGLPEADAVNHRAVMLANDDVRICWAEPTAQSPLYRDAVGDECVFVASGRARLDTVFGSLEVQRGDEVIIPTSVIHRWTPLDGDDPLRLLIAEASGHITSPQRYLSPKGQFLEGAPYCERDVRSPAATLLEEGTDVDVMVRHRTGGSRHTYAHHPFDVEGWDGCLYPYALSIFDFQPKVSPTLQPPTTYQAFEGPGFVMCSFVPHKMEWHPDAIPVPYNHANVDSDEVMFYFDGNFGSRGKQSGIDRYSLSLHPTGFVHGPHPGAVAGALKAKDSGVDMVQEMAFMIDTFRPLAVGAGGQACDQPDYAHSWSRPPASA